MEYALLHCVFIQAIIETVAGNFENQEAVFQCQVTDTVNYLLKNLIDETLISTHVSAAHYTSINELLKPAE